MQVREGCSSGPVELLGLDCWSEASSSWMRGEDPRPEGGEALRGSDSSAPPYVTEERDHVTQLNLLWLRGCHQIRTGPAGSGSGSCEGS